MVKFVVLVSGGWLSKKIELFCELLFGIVCFGNEYMSMVVFDIFEMIFEGMVEDVVLLKLLRLLEIIKELCLVLNDI